MKKLINASFVGLSKSGKAYFISVELDDGRHVNVNFPVTEISFEELKDGERDPEGNIYVENWILVKREEEVGNYITNEDA